MNLIVPTSIIFGCDSLLRHSNILNGLFHSKVVICESDSDCRFFSAVLSALYDDTNAIAPDILFVHCGGKHRIPTVIKALKRLNVHIKVITDFDVLNNINPIKEIYEDLGGIWTDIENDWKIVKKEIEQKRLELSTDDVKQEIEACLSSVSSKVFPKDKVKEIEKILKKTSAWSEAKEVGKSLFCIHGSDIFNTREIPANDNFSNNNLSMSFFHTLLLFCS